MTMFANLAKDPEIKDEERDSLGGFSTPESDIYGATIKVAYVTTAASGAVGVNVVFTLADEREHRETLWVQSGKAKGGNNYYLNQKGEKKYLPGYLMADSLCLVAAGQPLSAQATEDKILNLYSAEAGKEVPTKVPVLMGLVNKAVVVGLIKKIENKNKKNAAGQYEATAETREVAELDKAFDAEGFTITERKAGATEPKFVEAWKKKWQGQTKDVRTIKDGQGTMNAGGGFVPGAAQAQAAQPTQAAPAVSNLFN